MSWAALFERAADSDVTVADVRESLARRRDASETTDGEGGDP